MQELTVELGSRSYRISVGRGILDSIGDAVEPLGFSGKCAIVSNPTVYGLYGSRVLESLQGAGLDVYTVLIPDGEEYKDLLWAYHILSRLLKTGLDRNSVIFALGGGVVGDITGFCASTYMRGISYIQIPTTLLSQVDSSVGGKTGVNHHLGKNMIGTFYQPGLVWIDIETLKTLPERELLSGIAEVIKYGVIWDREFFEYLDKKRDELLGLDPETLSAVIRRSCGIKAAVVSKDERESGLRAILNYGHTVGHAIETVTGYQRYLHGEAVAMGMVYEAEIACCLGMIDREGVDSIRKLVRTYGLPAEAGHQLNMSNISKAMALDKKALSGTVRFVLPEEIGKVKIVSGVDTETLGKVMSGI